LADSWYSSLDNVKCIRDLGWYWVVASHGHARGTASSARYMSVESKRLNWT